MMVIRRIKTMIPYCLAGMLAMSLSVPGSAQDLTITAQVAPQQARVGDHMRLVITIEGQANVRGTPELPELSAFQVYGGGRSSNFSFVNGQVSSALTFTYVLVPQQSGRFSIGPVKIKHGGQVYATKPIEVVIGQGGQSSSGTAAPGRSSSAPRSASPPPTGQGNSTSQQQPVFITTAVNKQSVFVNEPVILTFKFYRRVPILSQPQYSPPTTNGFWSEDLPPQKTYVTNLNGMDYEVTEINTALFPTAAGELTIAPARLVVTLRGQSRRSVDPFADDFFNNFFSRGRQVELRSQPITLNVKAVPTANRPSDYTGTVGQWSMSAKLDRKTARVGDAVTLEVRLFGEGNVKSVGKPKLPPLTGFMIYETVSSSEVQKQNNRIKGVKIYRTLIRPQIKGELTIPTITYSYFNPQNSKFEQVKVPPLSLSVQPGQTGTTTSPVVSAMQPQASGPGVQVIAKDIRYLKTNVKLKKAEASWPTYIWIAWFLGLPCLLGLAWLWQRHRDHLASDPRYARKLTADRSARKVVKAARAARRKNDAKLFYTSLAGALSGYLADQLGYSRSGITQREIIEHLRRRQADTDMIDRLTRLFDECDFARFAPGERDAQAMEKHEQEAEKLLTSLMKVLNQEKRP